jgi:NAD(P)-dependent dehydrogenase (short-subunit alcohol dehydrogenase family)
MGYAIARRLAGKGAHVYITGRRASLAEQVANDIGEHANAAPGDVSRASDLDRIVGAVAVAADGRRLDHVVAGAGAGTIAPLAETGERTCST